MGDPGIEDDDPGGVSIIKALRSDDSLPRHLRAFERQKSMIDLEVSYQVNACFDAYAKGFLPTIPLDASSFALWLHQNVLSFCSDVEQAGEAIEHICLADNMRTDDDIVIEITAHSEGRSSAVAIEPASDCVRFACLNPGHSYVPTQSCCQVN